MRDSGTLVFHTPNSPQLRTLTCYNSSDIMDAHTLRVLEFARVLEKLAAHTSNTMGREAARALEPTTYPEIVRHRLQETRAARLLMGQDSGMPLGGVHDIREAGARAAI